MTRAFTRGLLVSICIACITGCTSVPFDYPRKESRAIPPRANTKAGSFAIQWQEEHPGKSGFLSLARGLDGLGARLRLLDAAEVSVDAQYFLVKPDEAGRLFVGKLLRAADRGVRVRLLIDDIFTPRSDDALTTLASHPQIEVRLFNPLSRRSPAAWSMFWDFARTNRRMHNKAFIVDNAMAITGGRNIAAEYFELKPAGNFDDFEVLATGPVVEALTDNFDSFWNHSLSLPIEALGREPHPELLDRWRQEIQEVVEGSRPSAYARAVSSEFLQEVLRGERGPEPATATLVSDLPQKLEARRGEQTHLLVAAALEQQVTAARREITLITPYFLPGKRGRELLKKFATSGVQVRVITNSLASTNHVPVHAHYRKYRRELLEAGVEIHELRADRQPGWEEGAGAERLTLHTKLFEIDGETVVLGSVNLDPRSIEINTEQIIIIDSSELSGRLVTTLQQELPDYTWQLRLDERGRVQWHYGGQGGPEVVTREPGASFWRRFQAGFYRLLPIERQL
jgi:putative cardiolipin synthase